VRVPAKRLCDLCEQPITGDPYLEIGVSGVNEPPRWCHPAFIRHNCILDTASDIDLCSRSCVVAFLHLDEDWSEPPVGGGEGGKR
jgi:hypothetical protein